MTYRQILDEAVGTPPPTSVDLDGIIGREVRRARRRRRGAAGAAALAVFALAGATAVVVDGGQGRPQSTDSRPATPMPRPTGPWSSAPVNVPLKYDGELRDRFGGGALFALRQHLPRIEWLPDYSVWEAPVDPPKLLIAWFGDAGFGQAGYGVTKNVMVEGRRGHVDIVVEPVVRSTGERMFCPPPEERIGWTCEERTGPDGERVRVTEGILPRSEVTNETPLAATRKPQQTPSEATRSPQPARPWNTFQVRVLRPDGMLVTVDAVAWSTAPLFTVDQAVEIGRYPALTLR